MTSHCIRLVRCLTIGRCHCSIESLRLITGWKLQLLRAKEGAKKTLVMDEFDTFYNDYSKRRLVAFFLEQGTGPQRLPKLLLFFLLLLGLLLLSDFWNTLSWKPKSTLLKLHENYLRLTHKKNHEMYTISTYGIHNTWTGSHTQTLLKPLSQLR